LFAITIDTDWASNQIIADTVNLLEQYNINGTFFVTNKIDFDKLAKNEIAVHPNFNGFSDQEKILGETIHMLPTKQSIGCRSHKLYHNSSLLASYPKYGIKYDSNYYMPDYENPLPFFFKWVDVLEIPIFFTDDGHYESSNYFDWSDVNLNDSGLKVFLFHPFHIFMNTNSYDDYKSIKSHYQDFDFLQKNKNYDKQGVRNLFISLLEYIEKNNIITNTLENINNTIRKNKSIEFLK